MQPEGGKEEKNRGKLPSPKPLLPKYLHDGLAGAISGALSRMVTAPFDVAKIRGPQKVGVFVGSHELGDEGYSWDSSNRYQLDHRATGRYKKSLLDAMRSIYSEEGVVSLWRGNLPAMLLWATFSGVQFGTYEQFQKMDPLRGTVVADTPSGNAPGGGRSEGGRGWRARAKDDEDEADGGSGGRRWGVSRGARNFLYGATSGAVATVATYPLDVARTALAYQGVPKRYESLMAFVAHTLRDSGPSGFFRGSLPALVMIAPQMGVSFAVYERLKRSIPVRSLGAVGASPDVTSMRGSDPDVTSVSGATESGLELERRRSDANRARESVPRVSGAGGVASTRKRPESLGEGGLTVGVGVCVLTKPESNGQVRRRVAVTAMTAEDGAPERGALIAVRRDGGLGWGASEKGGSRIRPEVERLVQIAWPVVSGGVAGMTSKLVVMPLDTVKKRLQKEVMIERDASYGVLPRYYGPGHALRTIVEEEGLRALFRGSVPALWKSGISTAVTFAVYEWVKTGLGDS